MTQVQVPSAWTAGDAAVERARAIVVYALVVAARNHVQEQPENDPHAAPPEPAPTVIPVVPAATSSTASVMACIRDHESGNYAESTHLSAGSGAYQYVPSTWQAWFGRWRDAVAFVGSDYAYAYEAPALIQDAVTAYAIEHGGAHNWDPSYGNDPCTVGLP